jgi:ABC-type uncharacterized transport system ATPase subunit
MSEPSYRPPVLELVGITKRFPGIIANDHVNLTLRRGEILALLGENGAGKSTLMNIIYGLYHADEGEIRLQGEPIQFANPREAIRAGIGMVHQHFQLIPVMTVAENVSLGEEKEFPATHEEENPKLDQADANYFRPSTALRVGWGVLWRAFTPVLAIALGLLAAQIMQQIVFILGTYLVTGKEFSTFAFERLPLLAKGLQTYTALYQTQPTLATILIHAPIVVGMLVGGGVMFRLGRYFLRTWRGTDVHARSIIDAVIEGVIDLGGTITATLRRRSIAIRVRNLSRQYGLEVDPDALIETLPVGLQQRVEIVKALYRKADILILDEPTAVLTPQEGQELFKIMRQLTEKGVSIIFITHKLKEVLQVADEIVVMRGGKVVGSAIPAESTEASLAALMVGRSVLLRVNKSVSNPTDPILQVNHLSAYDNRHVHALNDVSFEVRGGEVLGVAGVQGNGQTELVEVLTGLRPPHSGSFSIAGKSFETVTPRAITKAGTGHIPEDRQRYGMVSTYSVADNLVLNHYEDAPFAAPPTPRRLPIPVLLFALIFGLSFAALGTIWNLAIYPVLDSLLDLNNPDINPVQEPGRFVIAAVLSVIAVLVFGVVSGWIANTIAGLLRLDRPDEGGISINRAAVDQNAKEKVKKFDIRTPSIVTNAGNLSGGNQQKMVVAREFSRDPQLLIASQPTRGIDVGSIEFIHQQIIAQRDAGAAVLLVSAELDEILALSDRIAVMYHGQIIATLSAAEATREKLGLLMAGVAEVA